VRNLVILKLTLLAYRAKLYGIFSAKYLYIGSLALFEGGSALCGGAPTMNAMIVGRAIAGVGVITPPPLARLMINAESQRVLECILAVSPCSA
jgi:MFS family permease